MKFPFLLNFYIWIVIKVKSFIIIIIKKNFLIYYKIVNKEYLNNIKVKFKHKSIVLGL